MTERNFPPGKWSCKEYYCFLLHKPTSEPTSLLCTSLALLFFCPKGQRCFLDTMQELSCPKVSAPDETTPFTTMCLVCIAAAPWEPGMGLVHLGMGQVKGLSCQELQGFPRQECCKQLWHQCRTSISSHHALDAAIQPDSISPAPAGKRPQNTIQN